MTPDAQSICQAWLDAVNNLDLEAVLALYAEDAVLLPTFSPHILRTPDQRRSYFERLASRPGLRVDLREKTVSVQSTGSLAVASGIYRFQMEIDSELLGFEARFSYMLDPASPHPILHHHSSQIPRNLS